MVYGNHRRCWQESRKAATSVVAVLGEWVLERELLCVLNVTIKQSSHRKCHMNLTMILRKDIQMKSYVYYYAILGKELITFHPGLTLCASKGQSYMTQNTENSMQKTF